MTAYTDGVGGFLNFASGTPSEGCTHRKVWHIHNIWELYYFALHQNNRQLLIIYFVNYTETLTYLFASESFTAGVILKGFKSFLYYYIVYFLLLKVK